MWLGQFLGPLAVEPVHELTFGSPFPMEGYSDQPRYREEGFGPASSDVTDFVGKQGAGLAHAVLGQAYNQ